MLGLFSPQQPQAGFDLRGSFNLFYILVRGYATCVGIFLKRRFGSEALGFPAIAAILIMVVYMVSYPESREMGTFFSAWWIMLLIQRLGHFNARRKGIILHSQFDGESVVGVLLPFLNFSDLPAWLDVVICCGLGWSLHSIDAPLGTTKVLTTKERFHGKETKNAATEEFCGLLRLAAPGE